MTDTTSSPEAQLRERMATRWGPALETPAEPAASVMLVGPEDRPVATPDTAHDPAAERWWILDPDGHRDLQGRKIGLPAGIQAQGWSCTGVSPRHGGEPWYAEVRRLSPACSATRSRLVMVATASRSGCPTRPGGTAAESRRHWFARSRSRTRYPTGTSPGGRTHSARRATTGGADRVPDVLKIALAERARDVAGQAPRGSLQRRAALCAGGGA